MHYTAHPCCSVLYLTFNIKILNFVFNALNEDYILLLGQKNIENTFLVKKIF